MTVPSWRERARDLAPRLAGRHRWLAGAIVAMLVATAVVDPTIGAADAPALLDLGASPTPSIVAPTAPIAPTGSVVAPRPGVREPGRLGDASPIVPPIATPDAGAPTEGPDPSAPESPGSPPPAPCASAAIVEVVADAQRAIEAAAGAPLPVDVAGLFTSLAGCGDSTTPNPLDALGVVSQLLDSLGIENIPLPSLPPLPLPATPPAGFDALGPTVLPVCATVIKQLVTVASVAPVLRIRTADVIAFFGPLVQVCAMFAPRA